MKTVIVILLALLTTACGSAKANSARAETIPAPQSGYTCFIIYDGEGKAVGGNCVKSE